MIWTGRWGLPLSGVRHATQSSIFPGQSPPSAGSLFDSLLGATVQAIYFCPKDQKETERQPLHTCGTETVHLRGWEWLNNDWVNFGCGAMGAVLAVGMFLL
jgi:uncharacterized membrane protein